MKIYSYTDNNYLSPNIIFDDNWPVQFIEGFSAFYKDHHNNNVIIIEDTVLKIFIPINLENLIMILIPLLNCEINHNNQQIQF